MTNREPGYYGTNNYQPKKKGGCLKIGGIAALALFVAVGVGTCTASGNSSSDGATSGPLHGPVSETTSTPVAPPMEVTAQQMIEDLKTNALGASNTYKDKRVKVTGQVNNIDAQGKYISIDGGEFTLTSILCRIKGDELLGVVAGLRADQPVVVTGTVTDVGEVMGYTIQTETIEAL